MRVTGRVYGEPSTQSRMASLSCLCENVLMGFYLLYIPPKHLGSSEISYFACFPVLFPPTHSDLLVLRRSQHLRISIWFLCTGFFRLHSPHYSVVTTVATTSIRLWRACLRRFDSLLNSNLASLIPSSTLFWSHFNWML